MKKVLALILAVVFCLSFAGCTGNSNNAKMSDTTASAAVNTSGTNKIDNTAGLYNGLSYDGKYYYGCVRDNNDNVLFQKMALDGSKSQNICKLSVESSLALAKYYNGYIYLSAYDSDADKTVLYKVVNDKLEKITALDAKNHEAVSSWAIADEKIIFSTDTAVYIQDITSSASKLLIQGEAVDDGMSKTVDFAVINDKIYYFCNTPKYDKSAIYSADTDGSNVKKLCDGQLFLQIKATNNNVYFIHYAKNDADKGTYICVLKNNGFDKIKEVMLESKFTVIGSKIIYTKQNPSEDLTENDTAIINCCDIKGNSDTQILKDKIAVQKFDSAGEKLVIYAYDVKTKSYRHFSASPDGTGFKQLG